MQHADIQTDTATRYINGEFSEEEAAAFEEHYFDCPICARDIRDEMRVIEGVKNAPAVSVDPPPPNDVIPFPRPRRAWVPAAAAAVLVIAIGLPSARYLWPPRVPSPPPTVTVAQIIEITPQVRGEAPQPAVFQAGPVVMYCEWPLDPPYATYVATVRGTANGVLLRRSLTPEEARQNKPLLLSALPAGSYVLVMEGVRENGNRASIATKPFEVRR